MKKLLASLALCLIPVFAWGATANLANDPANPSTGITQTNYYGIASSGSTCPTLPWTSPVKVVVTGAAVGGTVVIPGTAVGQLLCFYATFQAGTLESSPSNIVSGYVPVQKPSGLTITGPLTIQ